jgi:hypothetical protein
MGFFTFLKYTFIIFAVHLLAAHRLRITALECYLYTTLFDEPISSQMKAVASATVCI